MLSRIDVFAWDYVEGLPSRLSQSAAVVEDSARLRWPASLDPGRTCFLLLHHQGHSSRPGVQTMFRDVDVLQNVDFRGLLLCPRLAKSRAWNFLRYTRPRQLTMDSMPIEELTPNPLVVYLVVKNSGQLFSWPTHNEPTTIGFVRWCMRAKQRHKASRTSTYRKSKTVRRISLTTTWELSESSSLIVTSLIPQLAGKTRLIERVYQARSVKMVSFIVVTEGAYLAQKNSTGRQVEQRTSSQQVPAH